MKSSKRLYQIDLLRFLAALAVVFYHYCFRGYKGGNLSPLEFQNMEFFAKYGFLGVDIFFIISGFVILMSVINSNIISFVISRISRLYPAYWVCLILTSLVIILWGNSLFEISEFTFLTNLTMLHGFIGIQNVDGVYWSLLVELKFYIIIGLLLLFRKLNYLTSIMVVWLTISSIFLITYQEEWNIFLFLINYFFIPNWAPYFIAGMLFYRIREEGVSKLSLGLLLICLLLCLGFAELKVEVLNAEYSGAFSSYIVYCCIFAFYLIFYFFSTDKLNFLNRPLFFKLGVMTYPLYLLHQNIGYIIFNRMHEFVNKDILLIGTILVMLILSYQISVRIEKPARHFIIQKMKNSLMAKKGIQLLKIDKK